MAFKKRSEIDKGMSHVDILEMCVLTHFRKCASGFFFVFWRKCKETNKAIAEWLQGLIEGDEIKGNRGLDCIKPLE